MSNHTHITKSLEDIYYKVGRNLLCYQQIEKNIKLLLNNSKISIEKRQNELINITDTDAHSKSMLGILINNLFNLFITSETEINTSSTEPTDSHDLAFRYSHHITMPDNNRKSLQNDMASILNDRNNLVHHLLINNNNYDVIDKELDVQYSRALPIQELTNNFINGMIATNNFSFSIPYQILVFYPEIIESLHHAETHNQQPDGWTPFSSFQEYMNTNHKETFNEMKNNFGFITTSSFLEKNGIIELRKVNINKKINLLFRQRISYEQNL